MTVDVCAHECMALVSEMKWHYFRTRHHLLPKPSLPAA